MGYPTELKLLSGTPTLRTTCLGACDNKKAEKLYKLQTQFSLLGITSFTTGISARTFSQPSFPAGPSHPGYPPPPFKPCTLAQPEGEHTARNGVQVPGPSRRGWEGADDRTASTLPWAVWAIYSGAVCTACSCSKHRGPSHSSDPDLPVHTPFSLQDSIRLQSQLAPLSMSCLAFPEL